MRVSCLEGMTPSVVDPLIEVEVRSNYGRDMLYPANTQAKAFCALLGTKTLPLEKVDFLKKMGFTIQAITPQSKLLGMIAQTTQTGDE